MIQANAAPDSPPAPVAGVAPDAPLGDGAATGTPVAGRSTVFGVHAALVGESTAATAHVPDGAMARPEKGSPT